MTLLWTVLFQVVRLVQTIQILIILVKGENGKTLIRPKRLLLLFPIAPVTSIKLVKRSVICFSKVGDLVVSNSDDDQVLEDYNVTASYIAYDGSKSGSGAGMKSLYEQWKKDTYD